jgi:oxygen-independent coproporphyrinogen-3 oxidase
VLAPDSAALADAAGDWASCYVHIPFCARVCPYCDFAVVEGKDDVMGRYVDAVLAEIDSVPTWRSLDTIFVGGGTPSRLPAALLGRVLERLAERHGLSPDAEITMEANPEDWSPATSDGFRAIGVTRVSFGAQSFDQEVLTGLGRLHGPTEIDAAVAAARDSGFESVSLDLIFGTPNESVASWRDTVDSAIGLGVDHVSTYALTVERGTALSREVAAGAPAPDEDDQADKYELALAALGSAGFVHYETSNHARPGHASRHNLNAWAQGEYLAFGLGAHRHVDGVRSWNVRRLDAYMDRLERGSSPRSGEERLDGDERELERLIVGLRRRAGVFAGERGRAWFAGDAGRRLAEAGFVNLSDGRLVIVNPLMTDTVCRELLSA